LTNKNKNQFEIIKASSEIDNQWLSYISEHNNAEIYHHPLWLKVLELETNNPLLRIVCKDQQGKIAGVLPMQFTRGMPINFGGFLAKRRISSLPRTPTAGVLADNDEITKRLIHFVINDMDLKRKFYIQLKTPVPEMYDNIEGLHKVAWRDNYLLKLPSDENSLMFGSSRNHRRIKWAINKAIKSGVIIREAESEEDLMQWYKLYLLTSQWYTIPARSFIFFKTLWSLMKDKGLFQLLLAEFNEGGKKKIIAGSVFLMFNQTVFYSFNGRDTNYLNLRPNDYLQWEAIHQAYREGFKYYNMGEVSGGQTGLADFKSKWGCEVGQIFHYYASHQISSDKIDLNHAGKGNLLTHIWRKLPVNLTEKLGSYLNNRL
jgi:hypothetical protein